MKNQTEKPYTIELYALLPATVALLTIAIPSLPGAGGWVTITLLLVLLAGTVACSGGVALPLVAFFVLFEKTLFFHPLVSFIGATVIGIHMLVTAESSRQPTLLRCAAFLLTVGASCVLFPSIVVPGIQTRQ